MGFNHLARTGEGRSNPFYLGCGSGSGSAPPPTRPFALRPEGHQLASPTSSAIAGTMIVRTTKVSSRTPNETAKPRWSRKVTGSEASTAKVPARMIPALVITGPVAASARTTASRVGRSCASSRTRLIRKML